MSSVISPLPLATRHFLLYSSLVFSKRRQIDSESALHDAAVKILMRRAHSVHEMTQALERRCENQSLIKNDARYASLFVQHRTESRKQGKFRIARDLRARGVPDRHIEAALEETAQQIDEVALVRQHIERKLRSFRGDVVDKKLASLYRSLLRAGFPADVVRRELKSITREDVSELGANPE